MNILGLLTGVGLLIGIGGNTVHQFERRASNDIKRLFRSPTARVRTRLTIDGPINGAFGTLRSAQVLAENFNIPALPLFVEPWRPKSGWIQKLQLDFSNFSLAGLHVQRLTAEIPDCRFDLREARRTKSVRLSQSGVGDATIVLAISDMEAFAKHKFREIKEIKLEFFGRKVLAKGRGSLLGRDAQFEILGEYSIENGRKVTLTNSKIWLDGHRANPTIASAMQRLFSPLVHLDRDLKLFGAFDAKSIQVVGERVWITGSMRIPNLPLFYANSRSSQSAVSSTAAARADIAGSSPLARASQFAALR